MKYFIEGERIGLSKLSAREATTDYVDWMNDPDVTRFLVSGAFPADLHDIERYIATSHSPTRLAFAIYRKDTKRHIGNVKLDHIDWVSRHADLGIMIGDRAAWGNGFGTEATRLITHYGFTTLNLERIYLGVVKNHEHAARVYRKLGFIEEGIRRQSQYVAGKYFDTLIMGMTRDEWIAREKRVVIVVQGRMSSSRLPGKVLRPLAGKPALWRQLERLQSVARAHTVVVATSIDVSDDPIAECCEKFGTPCIRGPLDDVLARFHIAAKETRADVVVRLTADCPLIDPDIVDACIARFLANARYVQYASNVDERSFPDGLDVEVADVAMLNEAHEKATIAADREHVTPWLRRRARKVTVAQVPSLASLRWTLDYPSDYEFIQTVYDELYRDDRPFTSFDVYQLLLNRPELIRTEPHAPPPEAEKSRLIRAMEFLITNGDPSDSSAQLRMIGPQQPYIARRA